MEDTTGADGDDGENHVETTIVVEGFPASYSEEARAALQYPIIEK